MRNKEPGPIGRLRKQVRALFDVITREELPQNVRELVEKLRQVEPVKPPLNDKKPPRSDDQ
jgi:hypothetical protein